MKLIEFKEQTNVYAKNQPEYLPLPCHKFPGEQGRIAFLWKLTFRDRLKILFTGKLWHEVLTFNKPLQPVYVSVDKPDMPTPNQNPDE